MPGEMFADRATDEVLGLDDRFLERISQRQTCNDGRRVESTPVPCVETPAMNEAENSATFAPSQSKSIARSPPR